MNEGEVVDKTVDAQKVLSCIYRMNQKFGSGMVVDVLRGSKNKKVLINGQKHLILEAAHPSPLAGNAFQGCKHFSKANAYLVRNGKPPVDWQIIW